jgi:ligand-binding sensor domain-containing protein
MLTDRNVSALAVDGDGRLWVGYFDRGLDVLSPGEQHTTHIEDSHIYCINRILPDSHRGVVDVATANGLVLFDGNGKQRKVLGKTNGLIAEHVTDVAFYSGGTVAATPAGLTFLDETGVHSLYAFQGLVNNHVYALGVSGGRLLAGTLGGLSVLDGGRVTKNLTTATSVLKHNWITAIVPVGNEWFIGTYGAGVQKLDTDGHFAATDATRAGVEINPNAMLATNQHIFAGTLGSGLMVGDHTGSHWKTIQSGLPSLNITALTESGGTLYIGTDNGLVRIPEERLEQ